MNRAGCALFGRRRGEIIGTTVDSLASNVRLLNRQNASYWFQRARTIGPQLIKWRCRSGGGLSVRIEVSLRCLPLGGRNAAVAIVRNLSGRKPAADGNRIAARTAAH